MTTLKRLFEGDNCDAAKVGAEAIFRQSPECSYETYVMSGEEGGCAWRQLEFDERLRCSICDRHGEAMSSGKIERFFRALCRQNTLTG